MALIEIQGHFRYFYLDMSVAYISGLWLTPGDLTKDDIANIDIALEGHFNYYKRFRCLYVKYTFTIRNLEVYRL